MTLDDKAILRLEKRMRRRGQRAVLRIVMQTVPIRKAGSKTTIYRIRPTFKQ
jgi:hypothetical protein